MNQQRQIAVLETAFSSDGKDLVDVIHGRGGSALIFTPQQRQWIAAGGVLPMSPEALAELSLRLKTKGN